MSLGVRLGNELTCLSAACGCFRSWHCGSFLNWLREEKGKGQSVVGRSASPSGLYIPEGEGEDSPAEAGDGKNNGLGSGGGVPMNRDLPPATVYNRCAVEL